MTTGSTLKEIEAALKTFEQDDLIDEAGRRLLDTLGYHSDRILELSGDVDYFMEAFPAPNQGTQTEVRFRDNVTSARILFQFTESEIAEAQPSLLDTGRFDKSNAFSFMFIAVELRETNYARGKYAEFTREVNKRLSMPAVVLFRTADDLVTLAFVHRRKHKSDQNRQVLGSVSLIREINASSPHPGQLHLNWVEKRLDDVGEMI